MTDVFISYKQEERERMAPIAEALRALGVELWFDARLEPGVSFTDEIQREIHACPAQIVCWSPAAAASEWVRGEADIGRQRGVLIPVVLEPCALPPPFNMFHAENLSDFSGQAGHHGWLKVLDALGAKLSRPGLAKLWPLLSEGDATAWKAWAEANPSDPFNEQAWARYEALQLDAERNRMAGERAAARERAEADEARRIEQESRAEAERARLAAMREHAEAEAEAGRRAAMDAAPEPAKPNRALRTGLVFAAVLAGAVFIAQIAVSMMQPSPPTEVAVANVSAAETMSAPVRSISPAFAEALNLRGRWAASAEECARIPLILDAVNDERGERIIWNSNTDAAEQIFRLDDNDGVVTRVGGWEYRYLRVGNRLQVKDPTDPEVTILMACP